ncbi:phospholipase SGR2-like isoform X2 [Zingiber officinale]|uniref:phospholipase SGR2-like isoform X2 n=1 Tax=Zingiber officinale TaxID=94328 RepID=UPI001C4D0609|nr:phospholipase SGR2-like isoform X2 [Zingiber officinale]
MANAEVTSAVESANEDIPLFSDISGYNQVEEISPDLLKNTPSNIAKLEDAIEHCKAHQKYLACTKSPSDGDDVRWYFCKVPLAEKELAASVPRTEIIGKSDYFRFSKRDSLALEASFLQMEEELLAHWWKEYAECSEGPSGPQTTSSLTFDYKYDELYAVEEERVGVPVKGGLYEVDLTKRHCFPVYWSGENRRVLRGHWFARKGGLDWLPLREDVAEQLELAYNCRVWHRRTFQPSGQFAARIDLQGTSPGLHALFTGENDSWEAWLAFENIGFSFGGGAVVKLRRGFSTSGSVRPTQDELRQQKEEEMDDYCSQVPVGHLVFMVHGIGQRLEKANLVDDVGDFRRITSSLAERHLTSYQKSTQRILFIPCQWRKGLKLSGESAVEKITLDDVRGLRMTLSATVHDVLYYMSPIYCQDIIDSVSNQLNRLYSKFLKRNPGYDGKVSLYGHSLGSVLSYDILCHQEGSSALYSMDSVLVKSVGVPIKESKVDASYQPTEPNVSMRYENNSTKTRSASDPYNTVNYSTQDLSVSEDNIHAKDLQEVFSDNDGIMDPEEEFDDLDQLYFKDDAAVRDGRSQTEDKADKDKIIILLEEEVKSLRMKIAGFEKIHQSATYFKTNPRNPASNEICHAKGKLVESISLSSGTLSKEENVKTKSYTPLIKYTKLDFKVDTFFAVGSPLGVFLALRNVRIGVGRGQDYWKDETIIEEIPACRQMLNIFHPFDPVAYRVEPLICKEYICKRPVIIPYHRGGKRLHTGFQEFTEEIASHSRTLKSQINSLTVNIASMFQPQNKDNNEGTLDAFKEKERSYGSFMIEKLTGNEDGRVDHALQDITFRHPYLSVMKSHTNYWRDKDTALFILNHLYRDIPEEPYTSSGETTNLSGPSSQRVPTKLFYERDIIAEETPLTFSDRYSIKEFSREVKNVSR